MPARDVPGKPGILRPTVLLGGTLPVLNAGLVVSILAITALALTHPWPMAMLAAYALVGVGLGLLITPQQVRLFAIDASRATVAVVTWILLCTLAPERRKATA